MLRTRGKRRKIGITMRRIPSLMLSSMVVPIVSNFAYYTRLHGQGRATRVPVLLLATGTRSGSDIRTSCHKTSSCIHGPFGPRILLTGITRLLSVHHHLGRVCAHALLRASSMSTRGPRNARDRFVRRILSYVRNRTDGPRFGIGILTKRLRVDRTALCHGLGRRASLSTIRLVHRVHVARTTFLLVRADLPIARMTRHINFGSLPAFHGRFASVFNISPSGCTRSGRGGGWGSNSTPLLHSMFVKAIACRPLRRTTRILQVLRTRTMNGLARKLNNEGRRILNSFRCL